MPKSISDLDTINKRISEFLDMKTSNHYANRATFFPKIPRDWVAEGYYLEDLIKPIPKPVLNELGKSLIGFSSDTSIYEEDL